MKYYFHHIPCIIDDSDVIVKREKITLKQELEKTRSALENAYSGFDNVTEPALIDSYIYEVNSIMKRYSYLLSLAEDRNN